MDSVGNDPIRHSRGFSSEICITCISHIRLSEGVTCETKQISQCKLVPMLKMRLWFLGILRYLNRRIFYNCIVFALWYLQTLLRVPKEQYVISNCQLLLFEDMPTLYQTRRRYCLPFVSRLLVGPVLSPTVIGGTRVVTHG